MIKKLAIVVIMLASLIVKADVKDTCQIPIPKFNIQKELTHAVLTALTKKEFYPLTMFCSGYVDFTIISDKKSTSTGTEYKAMQTLSTFMKQMDYVRINITAGTSKSGRFMILCELFPYRETDDYVINVVFLTDHNSAINEIVLY